jgi:hypothetical protein
MSLRGMSKYTKMRIISLFIGTTGGRGSTCPDSSSTVRNAARWVEITKLSTANAQLAHSPPFEEAPLAVSWNHSYLKSQDYAELPLLTTSSIMFPDEIVYELSSQAYHLNFDPSFKPKYQTWFWVLKKDLEKAFGS